MYKKYLKNIKGFTLIELLIVIAIVSLLSAIVVVSLDPSKIIGSTRESKRAAELRSISTAFQQYFVGDFTQLRNLNNFDGYSNLLTDAINGIGDCPNATNLSNVSDAYTLDTTSGANKINVSPLIQNSYISRLAKDPLDNSNYKVCMDTANKNQLIIFSPIQEVPNSTNYVAVQPNDYFTSSITPVPISTPTPTLTPTPTPTINLAQNGGFETVNGSNLPNNWYAPGDQDGAFIILASETTTIRTGARSIKVTSRSGPWAGPEQIVSTLQNNQNYYTEVWLRRVTSGSANAIMTVRLDTSNGIQYIQLTTQTLINSTAWTKVSGNALISWTGTLNSAVIYIETISGTAAFFADDVIFRPQ